MRGIKLWICHISHESFQALFEHGGVAIEKISGTIQIRSRVYRTYIFFENYFILCFHASSPKLAKRKFEKSSKFGYFSEAVKRKCSKTWANPWNFGKY